MWSQEFADTNCIPFFETSAKFNRNVEAAFLRLTRDILERVTQPEDPKTGSKPKSITLRGARLPGVDNKSKDGCNCGIM